MLNLSFLYPWKQQRLRSLTDQQRDHAQAAALCISSRCQQAIRQPLWGNITLTTSALENQHLALLMCKDTLRISSFIMLLSSVHGKYFKRFQEDELFICLMISGHLLQHLDGRRYPKKYRGPFSFSAVEKEQWPHGETKENLQKNCQPHLPGSRTKQYF